jgi:hypothetical protein
LTVFTPKTNIVPLLFVLGLILLSLVALDRPLIRGDGLAYYMWLDSIAGDGDMDLSNQADRFAHVNPSRDWRPAWMAWAGCGSTMGISGPIKAFCSPTA